MIQSLDEKDFISALKLAMHVGDNKILFEFTDEFASASGFEIVTTKQFKIDIIWLKRHIKNLFG